MILECRDRVFHHSGRSVAVGVIHLNHDSAVVDKLRHGIYFSIRPVTISSIGKRHPVIVIIIAIQYSGVYSDRFAFCNIVSYHAGTASGPFVETHDYSHCGSHAPCRGFFYLISGNRTFIVVGSQLIPLGRGVPFSGTCSVGYGTQRIPCITDDRRNRSVIGTRIAYLPGHVIHPGGHIVGHALSPETALIRVCYDRHGTVIGR